MEVTHALLLIGANALIGEGKEIAEGSLVVGSPGRVVRKLSDEEILGLRNISAHYVEKSKLYREELTPYQN